MKNQLPGLLRCAHEEGAQLVLTNAPIAMRMGEINKLAAQVNAPVIPCDVSNAEDVDNLLQKPWNILGEVLILYCIPLA